MVVAGFMPEGAVNMAEGIKYKVGFTTKEMKTLVDTLAMVLAAYVKEDRKILRKNGLRPSERAMMRGDNAQRRDNLSPIFQRLSMLEPETTIQPFPKV
jgi:hypothetical protein